MTERPRNPFRPGVGRTPLYLAGRDRELREFRKVLRGAPEIPANIRLTGLRGVGKTVLLREYREIASDENWAEVLLEAQPRHVRTEDALLETIVNELRAVTQRMSTLSGIRAAASKARDAITIAVTYQDISVTLGASASQVETDLSKALFDVVEAALDKGYYGFLLMIDEAQIIKDATRGVHRKEGGHPLSSLLAAVSGLQKLDVPIGLVLCGLPPIAANLLRARTYSERMFRAQEVGSLDDAEAREAFVLPLAESPLDADAELVDSVIDEVEGYPFFIQLYGAELWDAAIEAGTDRLSKPLFDAVKGEILQRLDREFYANRIETLTPAEQALLMDAARCPYPPLHVADLRAASPKTDKTVNVLLGRIAEAGAIYRVRQGQYEYTAPKFADYLRRREPATADQDALWTDE